MTPAAAYARAREAIAAGRHEDALPLLESILKQTNPRVPAGEPADEPDYFRQAGADGQ